MTSTDSGVDIESIGNQFLPLLARYERWPEGCLEQMAASGEAMRTSTVLAMMVQEEGLTEKQMADRISTGHVSQVLQQLRDGTNPNADPTPLLMKAIADGRLLLKGFLDALQPHLPDEVRGFAVDLASGSAFFPQNLARRWPGLKMYPTDHHVEKHTLTGTDFMNWCLQQFAESPERDFEQLATRKALKRDSTGDVQVNLLDSLWFPDSHPYPNAEHDSQISSELWDRASNVDVSSAEWPAVAHLRGVCKLVSCTSLLVQVGYRDPEIWKDMVRGAADLLEEGGVLFLYDTSKWAGYLNKEVMQKFCEDESTGLTLVLHETQGEADDVNGPMVLEILRKNPYDVGHCCPQIQPQRYIELASGFRDQGNKCFACRSSQKSQEAVAQYTKAIDALAAGQWPDRNLASRLESNRSAALMDVDRWSEALAAADKAVHWDPKWPKAQFRRAKALQSLGRDAEAIAATLLCDQLKVEETESTAPPARQLQAKTQEPLPVDDKKVQPEPANTEATETRQAASNTKSSWLGRLFK